MMGRQTGDQSRLFYLFNLAAGADIQRGPICSWA